MSVETLHAVGKQDSSAQQRAELLAAITRIEQYRLNSDDQVELEDLTTGLQRDLAGIMGAILGLGKMTVASWEYMKPAAWALVDGADNVLDAIINTTANATARWNEFEERVTTPAAVRKIRQDTSNAQIIAAMNGWEKRRW